MTREEAIRIPELQIFPNEIVEDAFYYKMAQAGRLPAEQGQKAWGRLEQNKSNPCYRGAFFVADMMIENLDKYGVPCAGWCE